MKRRRSARIAESAKRARGSPWYEKCYNPSDPFTLDDFEEDKVEEDSTIKIFVGDEQKASCYNIEDLKRFWSTGRSMRTWIPQQFQTIGREGWGGSPSNERMFKLPLTNTYITDAARVAILLEMDQAVKDRSIRLVPFYLNQRIGNREAFTGSSALHGQEPGFTVYSVLCTGTGKVFVYSGVSVRASKPFQLQVLRLLQITYGYVTDLSESVNLQSVVMAFATKTGDQLDGVLLVQRFPGQMNTLSFIGPFVDAGQPLGLSAQLVAAAESCILKNFKWVLVLEAEYDAFPAMWEARGFDEDGFKTLEREGENVQTLDQF